MKFWQSGPAFPKPRCLVVSACEWVTCRSLASDDASLLRAGAAVDGVGGVRGTVHSETDGVELAVGAKGVAAVQVAVRQAGGADAEQQRHHTDF